MIYGIIGAPQVLLLLLVGIFCLLLPLLALIDILKNEFSGNNKIVWVLVVIFFSLLGSILYFTIGKNQKINS
ncbi:PLDc N-terminal domain-containing protein [Zhouia sp. PK063]|uniref:PLDc N-terminal domain-containing protein n=1 Tax=Zhouia sp. PK063 TaxID=3373602 RepID=UPI0037AE0711